MITVVNKKTYKGNGVYIGRPSMLGNPYTHLNNSIAPYKVNTHKDSIVKFREYFEKEIKRDGSGVKAAFEMLVKRAKRGEDITFICWCKPNDCHGDIIKELIEKELEDGS